MDFDKLETMPSRVIFGFVVILLLVSLFLILHYVIYPNLITGETKYLLLRSILETLFSSLAVAVIIGSFLFWASPRREEVGELRILQPYQINNYHRECRENTFEWWYDGGSGRYTRDVTLPSFVELCKEQRKKIHICIYILDPRNSDICQMYADYSNLVNPNNRVTQTDVKCDLLATIVAAYFYKKNLDIDLYLKSHFSIFKREFSDNMVLITREDRTKPGMVYSKDSDFYGAYKMELEQGRGLYTQLDGSVNWGMELVSCKKITIRHIEQLLELLKWGGIATGNELQKVQQFVKNKTTPYAK